MGTDWNGLFSFVIAGMITVFIIIIALIGVLRLINMLTVKVNIRIQNKREKNLREKL